MNEHHVVRAMTTVDSRQAVGVLLAVVAVALLAVAGASGAVAAHGGDDGAHHHDGWMGGHDGAVGPAWGGGWLLWPLLALIALVGVPVGGYLLLTDGNSEGDDALAVLRERYARGEIDDEEYERRRSALRADER